MKLFPDGTREWERLFGEYEIERFNSVIQNTDGDFVTVGKTADLFGIIDYGWLVRMIPASLEWNFYYNSTDAYSNEFVSIAQTSDGGYIIAGNVGVVTSINIRYGWLVKLNPDFTLDWDGTYRYEVGQEDRFYSGTPTYDGGYIATGQTMVPTSAGHQGWIVKLSATTLPTPITTTTTTTTTSNGAVDPCDCATYGYQTPCTYWLLPGCDEPALPGYNPQAAVTTTTAATTTDLTTTTTTTTSPTTATTTTDTMNTTAITTASPSPAPTSATATTTTPASGLLITLLCGLFVVALLRVSK